MSYTKKSLRAWVKVEIISTNSAFMSFAERKGVNILYQRGESEEDASKRIIGELREIHFNTEDFNKVGEYNGRFKLLNRFVKEILGDEELAQRAILFIL